MKLHTVRIKNFRGIRDAKVQFDDLTMIVGQNDAGKSTVLDALDVFFNDVKLGIEDINCFEKKEHPDAGVPVEISCVFSEVEGTLSLEEDGSKTTFAEEGLLDDRGMLTVCRRYTSAGSSKTFVVCPGVECPEYKSLYKKNNSELKKLVENLNLSCKNKSINKLLRKKIREHFFADKTLEVVECELPESRLHGMMASLPRYELFKADRENVSGDAEAQSPMKEAVKVAFESKPVKELVGKLESLLRKELKNVMAHMTIAMQDFNVPQAGKFEADIPRSDQIKWWDVFKAFTIRDENSVSIDKRGSGIRRLVLLSFFRATAEMNNLKSSRGVIYAIEEPETAQHADNQILVSESLRKLSKNRGAQIVVTTHSGHVLKNLSDACIAIVQKKQGGVTIDDVRLNGDKKPFLSPISTVEISYIILGDCVAEYHSELYGLIELYHLKLEEWCCKMAKQGHGEYMRRYSRGLAKAETDHSYPMYIRDRLHHPENGNYKKPTDEEIRRSIGMMRTFMLEEGEKQLDDAMKARMDQSVKR